MNDTPKDGPCPDRQVLTAFVRDLLPPDTRRSTQSHISTCPGCSSIVRALSDDTAERSTLPFRRSGGTAVAEPATMFVPARIGQYEILGRIGRGGMGVVCRARHSHLKKLVALKILPPHFLSEAKMVARFEREMEVVGKLDNPNIVRATDAGSADGVHYLAMELIEGVDLARVLRTSGPLRPADACEVIRQAALGLQHAHENGLVHRDMKPGNLMISDKGQVKVLDLGLALLGDPSAESLTASGHFMGTPDYMSPEQFESTRVDIRSDVYALGCTLFALISGSPPFSGQAFSSVYSQLRAHREQPVPTLASPRGVAPAGFAQVLHRMLRKDPADRQQTPAEVAVELTPFCAGSDLTSLMAAVREKIPANESPLRDADTRTQPPGTVLERRPSRSRRRSLIAAGLLLLGGGAAALLAMDRWSPDEVKPGPPPAGGPGVQELKAGEWLEVLNRNPETIWWPKDPGQSRWIREADGSLLVSCGEWGMLSFGAIDADGFDLEATMTQTPWTGGVGVFVRGRDDATTAHVSVYSDLVYLDRILDPNVLVPAKLFHAEARRFTAPPRDMITDASLPYALVQRPVAESHQLTVTVGSSGVAAAAWDGIAAPEIAKSSIGSGLRPGARGKIGVWFRNSTTRFTSLRLRVHPPKGE